MERIHYLDGEFNLEIGDVPKIDYEISFGQKMTFVLKADYPKISNLFACSFIASAFIGILVSMSKIEVSSVDETKPNKTHVEVLTENKPFRHVRIFCLVLTTESHHRTKAIHVKNTWGKYCDKLIFASNVTDAELGTVKVVEKDHYELLWAKIKNTLEYVYENYYDDYDWFFKADDDTFAFIDNMRYLLSAYSPEDPIYFGKKFRAHHPFGFSHGGAGYVMSRAALGKFIIEGLDGRRCHTGDNGPEDGNVGACMYNVGVHHGDGRDEFQRERFNLFTPEKHLLAFPNDLYSYYLYYPSEEGLDCCSNYTVSFHYIVPDMMNLLDYLVFKLEVFGVRHEYVALPEKKNFTQVVQKLRAEVCEENILWE